jgi:hypothetical protein
VSPYGARAQIPLHLPKNCTSFPADAQVSAELCYKLANALTGFLIDAQVGLQ